MDKKTATNIPIKIAFFNSMIPRPPSNPKIKLKMYSPKKSPRLKMRVNLMNLKSLFFIPKISPNIPSVKK